VIFLQNDELRNSDEDEEERLPGESDDDDERGSHG
jgi:hypothetical protein